MAAGRLPPGGRPVRHARGLSAIRAKKPANRRQPADAGEGTSLEEWILLGLVLLEPLSFTSATRNPFIVKDVLLAAALLALAGIRACSLLRQRPACSLPRWPAALLGVLVMVQLVRAGFSTEPSLSRDHLLRLLGFVSLFLVIASRKPSRAFSRRFLGTMLVSTAVASSYGILQFLDLDPVTWTDTFRPAGAPVSTVRIFSTFGHPNFFGPHLAMAICFTGAVTLIPRSAPLRWVGAAVTALAIACLTFTANRGAWLGALAAALFAAVSHRLLPVDRQQTNSRPGKRLSLLLALSLTAVLFAVASSPLVRTRLAFSGILSDATVQSRVAIWSGTLRMIEARPLAGFGPGTFGRVFPRFRDDRLSKFEDELTPVTHAHNEYLEILAETGVIGLMATAAFWGAGLVAGWRTLREERNPEDRVFVTAAVAAVVSILVSSFFGVELRTTTTALFFWLLLGLLAAGSREERCLARPRIAAVAVIAGAVAFSAVSIKVFAAELLLRQAETSLAAGNYREAARAGRAAHDRNPAETAGLMIAGEALVGLEDFAGALAAYREVESINPWEPLIGYNLAVVAYRQGAWDEGLERIEAARRRSPGHEPSIRLHCDLLLKKGLALVERREYQAADSAFAAASRLRPRDTRALLFRGNVQLLLGKYENAAGFYRKVLLRDPDSVPAKENLAQVERYLASERQGSR